MREIVFKAKRLDNGEWLEGGFCQSSDGRTFLVGVSKRGMIDGLEVMPETICQYTGLTDKNGNKIWENDIVKKHFYLDDDCASDEYVGFVKNEYLAWVIKSPKSKLIRTFPIFDAIAYSKDVEYFEVIGNIFDNPELLGEQNG